MSDLKELIQGNPKIKNWLILDNIRSAYNVGAIFRTADGTGITGLLLVGISADPKEQPKVHKTALGAENSVPYAYFSSPKELLTQLKKLDFLKFLFSLELTDMAEDLFKWTLPKQVKSENVPLFTVVGHELLGVSSDFLVKSEAHLFIPMNGFKESLNVAESSSILMYEIYRKFYYS